MCIYLRNPEKSLSLDRCAKCRTSLHWFLYMNAHACTCTHWCANAHTPIQCQYNGILPSLISSSIFTVSSCPSETDRPLIKTFGGILSWYLSLSNFLLSDHHLVTLSHWKYWSSMLTLNRKSRIYFMALMEASSLPQPWVTTVIIS